MELTGSTVLSSEPELYDVVVFTLNDRRNNPLLIKAIVVNQVAKPIEDKYHEQINSLPHLSNLDLEHPNYSENEIFKTELLISAVFYWTIVEDGKPIREDLRRKYQDGRYTAKFPSKSEHPELPSNYVQNMTRSILRRLAKDPALFKFYG